MKKKVVKKKQIDPDVARYRDELVKHQKRTPSPTPSREVPLEAFRASPPRPEPFFVVHESIAEVLNHRAWQQGLATWLTNFHFDIYTILTFAYVVSEDQASTFAKEFVSTLGGESFAFIGVEVGSAGGRVHLHLLIGGLSSVMIEQGHRLWTRGVVKKWEPYDREGHVVRYVNKWPENSEVFGRLERHTAHWRNAGRKK